MFWNGQTILDETQGSEAIQEPLVLNSGNYLGACNVTGASMAQPLEKYNMEGSMLNFLLWTHRVSDEAMLAHTSGNLTELELSSLENMSIVSSERFENVGPHVRPYQTDDCSTKSKRERVFSSLVKISFRSFYELRLVKLYSFLRSEVMDRLPLLVDCRKGVF